MSFVNNGTDEAILKSLPAENASEELIKAMNKVGLVQKEVQVQRGGKTFTRKQWVRAGEEVEEPKQSAEKESDKAQNNNSSNNSGTSDKVVSYLNETTPVKSLDEVKFDKTQSGKVGGIQVGKELAPVVKTASGRKLREVTDPDTGKAYNIYTDTNPNKPDGIVAVEKQSSKK